MLDMIKCSTGGAYYARGEWVPADGNAPAALAAKGFDAAAVENAKTGTMAYSILQAHNTSGDAENLKIKFDAMASHDITFVGIIQTARASGLEKFPHPVCAHQLPQQPVRRGRHHQRGRPPLRPVGCQKVRRHLCAPASGCHPPVHA